MLRKNNRAENSHQVVRRRERKMHGSSPPFHGLQLELDADVAQVLLDELVLPTHVDDAAADTEAAVETGPVGRRSFRGGVSPPLSFGDL